LGSPTGKDALRAADGERKGKTRWRGGRDKNRDTREEINQREKKEEWISPRTYA
jgi:hypothetical protein